VHILLVRAISTQRVYQLSDIACACIRSVAILPLEALEQNID